MKKNGPDGYTYYAPRTDFFIDNMISPNYFENKFVQTIGIIGHLLEKCGVWFIIIFFLKLIIDITVTVMRTLEKHRITAKSVSFGKVLLSATYNIFMVSLLNSICSPTKRVGFPTTVVIKIARIYGARLSIYPDATQSCTKHCFLRLNK